MTLVPRWWPREKWPASFPIQERIFAINKETGLLTKCHWQPYPTDKPTILLIHGLEGCTESHYMLGLAHKIYKAGWNCVRINQRNCGGSVHLTPTLYHGGLSNDFVRIIQEISEKDGCQEIYLVGYSMGGNLILKLAGEMGSSLPSLRAAATVCPNIHPAACVLALQKPSNRLYHGYFLNSLKRKLQNKARLYPGKWDLSGLSSISTMWDFDDVYTGPDGGFRDATDYYESSGSRRVLAAIQIPTLVIMSQDDPFIPFEIFSEPALHSNPNIQLISSAHGGHCGFFQGIRHNEDPFWAENRIIDFIREQSNPQGSFHH